MGLPDKQLQKPREFLLPTFTAAPKPFLLMLLLSAVFKAPFSDFPFKITRCYRLAFSAFFQRTLQNAAEILAVLIFFPLEFTIKGMSSGSPGISFVRFPPDSLTARHNRLHSVTF